MTFFRLPVTAIAPLLLNGYALVANAGLTAVLGIVFWIAATGFYSQEQVGLAAALISSMTTISYFSQMNMSSFLTRFLPSSGTGAWLLIAKTYAAAGLVSAIVAAVFAIGIGKFAEPLEIIRNNLSGLVLFVVATVLWTIFALQDAALSGLRRSALVPVENTIYALLKIGLLLLLGAVAVSQPLGIFVAWTIPLLPVVVVVNVLIYRGLPTAQAETEHHGPDLRTASKFLGWDFLGSLALGSAFGLAPLMVTAAVGVESTATYHLAWSFAYSVYLIGRAMSVSLVAEGATNPVRLRRLIEDTLSHTLLLVTGAVVVMVIFAPLIMGMFGAAYIGDGTPVLRILALSCIPWAVTTIYCAVARVRRQTRTVAIVQAGTLLVFVAVSTPLVVGYGARGVAFGWLAAHTLVCAGIVVRIVLKEGWTGLIDWLLSLAGAGGRVAASLPGLSAIAKGRNRAVPPEILEGISQSGLRAKTMFPPKDSFTDIYVILLKSEAQPDEDGGAVLKFSASESGIASLQRNSRTLRSLAADDRLGPHAAILPEIILEETWGRSFCTAETAVRGIEGRVFLRQGKQVSLAMAAVASTLSDLHRRTSSPCIIDDDWARRWIDGPVDAVSRAMNKVGEGKAVALDMLRAELRSVFVGRAAQLGLGHGDIWPGNLFFATEDPTGSNLRLSGLIDWDTCRHDALAAVDACQLGLTFRMELYGAEFGPVVRNLLLEGEWTPEETAIFAASGFYAEFGSGGDATLRRGVLLLTWLSHVATVIGQSDRAALKRFWSLVNVDRVLATIVRTSAQVGR